MPDYAAARLNMVESQVRPNKVTDVRLLRAMLDVPREIFLPERLQGVAYVDEDIPVAPGRYLMEPMVFARLVQAAQIAASDNVLEIGGGPGYGAAVIAQLAGRVTALESDRTMAQAAEGALRHLGIQNVKVTTGALVDGFPAGAPYDVIVFGGAVERVPDQVIKQLAEGGRLLAVVAPPGEPGRATFITRLGGTYSRRIIFDASTPVLPGLQLEPGFAF